METEERPLFAIYKLSSDSENLSKVASADPEEKNSLFDMKSLMLIIGVTSVRVFKQILTPSLSVFKILNDSTLIFQISLFLGF